MFPIRNIKGDAIAFGGRLLQDKEKQAKYLIRLPQKHTIKNMSCMVYMK